MDPRATGWAISPVLEQAPLKQQVGVDTYCQWCAATWGVQAVYWLAGQDFSFCLSAYLSHNAVTAYSEGGIFDDQSKILCHSASVVSGLYSEGFRSTL